MFLLIVSVLLIVLAGYAIFRHLKNMKNTRLVTDKRNKKR